jgi:hypothetical protein
MSTPSGWRRSSALPGKNRCSACTSACSPCSLLGSSPSTRGCRPGSYPFSRIRRRIAEGGPGCAGWYAAVGSRCSGPVLQASPGRPPVRPAPTRTVQAATACGASAVRICPIDPCRWGWPYCRAGLRLPQVGTHHW